MEKIDDSDDCVENWHPIPDVIRRIVHLFSDEDWPPIPDVICRIVHLFSEDGRPHLNRFRHSAYESDFGCWANEQRVTFAGLIGSGEKRPLVLFSDHRVALSFPERRPLAFDFDGLPFST